MKLDEIKITLRNNNDELYNIWIDVADNSLSRRWLGAVNNILERNLHLEKNYCWLGWAQSARGLQYLCDRINSSIAHINSSNLDYVIDDYFTVENTINPGPHAYPGPGDQGGGINHDKFNNLHRYFEDLQGWSGGISKHYAAADPYTRWHIRQLNLLCHEYESLVLSIRKAVTVPEWQRPSQLMCWLQAPRFELEEEDYELFGIDTINRDLGGVFVGVNKAVGKHHWEVFNDEGRDSRISELVTSALRSQTEAAGDFDIEWARNPGAYDWQQQHLQEFRTWLSANGFDPEEKALTIGHPQVGQVDLQRSFGTTDYQAIWDTLSKYLDVYAISTSTAAAQYPYRYSDSDYIEQQIKALNV